MLEVEATMFVHGKESMEELTKRPDRHRLSQDLSSLRSLLEGKSLQQRRHRCNVERLVSEMNASAQCTREDTPGWAR